jgi:ABC-type multidrug transport system fused ATPase/permease subunit
VSGAHLWGRGRPGKHRAPDIFAKTKQLGQGAGFIFGYTSSKFRVQLEHRSLQNQYFCFLLPKVSRNFIAANPMLFMEGQKSSINSSSGTDLHNAARTEMVIDFRNIHFRYPTRPELQGLDLKVGRGEKLGLVGPSGSGKSTVINLVERFYDITTGELLTYSNPISSLDIKGLCSILGLVPQETSLYQTPSVKTCQI